jgi:hypothetical protein
MSMNKPMYMLLNNVGRMASLLHMIVPTHQRLQNPLPTVQLICLKPVIHTTQWPLWTRTFRQQIQCCIQNHASRQTAPLMHISIFLQRPPTLLEYHFQGCSLRISMSKTPYTSFWRRRIMIWIKHEDRMDDDTQIN